MRKGGLKWGGRDEKDGGGGIDAGQGILLSWADSWYCCGCWCDWNCWGCCCCCCCCATVCLLASAIANAPVGSCESNLTSNIRVCPII